MLGQAGGGLGDGRGLARTGVGAPGVLDELLGTITAPLGEGEAWMPADLIFLGGKVHTVNRADEIAQAGPLGRAPRR
jgi:hypothetical protein